MTLSEFRSREDDAKNKSVLPAVLSFFVGFFVGDV